MVALQKWIPSIAPYIFIIISALYIYLSLIHLLPTLIPMPRPYTPAILCGLGLKVNGIGSKFERPKYPIALTHMLMKRSLRVGLFI